ncbi:MAG: sulfotransferase [Gluconacetobacter sp.]
MHVAMMSSHAVHVISGLPRSGSTLLAALLNQHPGVHAAGHNTPVAPMLVRLMSLMSEGEYETAFRDGQWQRLLRGVVEGYHAGAHGKPVLVDIGRDWCAHVPLLAALYPDAKMICCVRDPVWILNSFERLVAGDPLLRSRLVPIAHRATQHDRIDYLMSREGAFGYAWRLVNEAFFGPHADRLMIVEYDRLVRDPRGVLAELEKSLGLAAFSYDTENVKGSDASIFDSALGTPGLHAVRPRVAPVNRALTLPPHMVERLAHQMFWREPKLNRGAVVIA